jgi:hypothetical protein
MLCLKMSNRFNFECKFEISMRHFISFLRFYISIPTFFNITLEVYEKKKKKVLDINLFS